ncbi:nucleotidyltransferase substrate binding protein [bacterium]|nr:nucleotidyltransferase substrate binding protein [bacterium]
MSNYDKLFACVDALQKADPQQAYSDENYRVNLIKQFNSTFGVASKILEDALRNMGMNNSLDDPAEFFRVCAEHGFIEDNQVWESMQNDRNVSLFVYNEKTTAEILVRIMTAYVPALSHFASLLAAHLNQQE